MQEISRKSGMKNCVAQEIEMPSLRWPSSSPASRSIRVADAAKRRLATPPAGVRCVWQRHDLGKTYAASGSRRSRPRAPRKAWS